MTHRWFAALAAVFLIAINADAGVKTRWTVDAYCLDWDPAPAPTNKLYSKTFTRTVLENGTQIGIGGSYNPLHPLDPSRAPTGDFILKLQSAAAGLEAKYFLTVWDRTDAPENGYSATFETESRMKPLESQRVYFTQGNFASGQASRYVLMIHLDSADPCDENSTCFTE